MAVITKINSHEREAAALAWLSEALKKGWRVRYNGKDDSQFKLSLKWREPKSMKKQIICREADTLLKVIEKAMRDE